MIQNGSGGVSWFNGVGGRNVRVGVMCLVPRNTCVLFGLQCVVIFHTVHVWKQHLGWLNRIKLRPIQIKVIICKSRVDGIRIQREAGISRMGCP